MKTVTIDLVDAMELSIELGKLLDILAMEHGSRRTATLATTRFNVTSLRKAVGNLDHNIIEQLQKEA